MRSIRPLRVSRTVGLNPIAQAVFRARIQGWLLDNQIRVLMLEPGEPCMDFIQSAGYITSIISTAASLDGLDTPETRIVRGGLGALTQMSYSGLWEPLQAVAIESAMVHAVGLLGQLKPRSINLATRSVGPPPQGVN